MRGGGSRRRDPLAVQSHVATPSWSTILRSYSSAHHHPKVRRTTLLRILLDARPIGDGRHGIARYVLSMAPYLAKEAGVEWVAACAPVWGDRFRGLGMRVVETGVRFTSPLAPFTLARIAREVRPDVTFCPSFVPPLPSRGPLVMTLHDATHLARPVDYSPLVRFYYHAITLPAARRGRVITVSEFSRRELEAHGGLRDVRVIPNGVDHDVFRPDGPRDERLPERSILYVGGYKPHKRVELLVDALPSVPGATLVLVGTVPAAILARAAALGVGNRVRPVGSLSDDELAAAYRSAAVFAFPSVMEGFGLPPLEAMACGTPVVCADSSSLPEVVGDGGLLILSSVGSFAATLSRLLDDPEERRRLRDAGVRRAAGFSFERAATQTVAVLLTAAGGLP